MACFKSAYFCATAAACILLALAPLNASASNLVIRSVNSSRPAAVAIEPTPAEPAPVPAGVDQEIRRWLTEQAEVDSQIFDSPEDRSILTFDAATPRPQPAAVRQASLLPGAEPGRQPVIRAVVAAPRQVASTPARRVCAWPRTCPRQAASANRRMGKPSRHNPSARSVNYALTSRLNLSAYATEVEAAATAFGIDPNLIRAVIHAESSFNPAARSRVGAQGLMQLMPATASRFGVTNSFEVSQNIWGGSRYLAWLLKRFNGDSRLAAAAYNAGEGAVDRYGGVPPYRETIDYVEKVSTLLHRYRQVNPR